MDVGLPRLDGYEVTPSPGLIVADRPRLITVTGYGRPEDRRRAEEAGFDVHLVKPADPIALRAARAAITNTR